MSIALLLLAGCRFGFDSEDDRVATFGGTEADAPRAVFVTSAGNVVIAGHFRTAIDLGCSPMASTGGADGFLIELTPELACVRTWQVRGPGDDLAIDAIEDHAGNFLVTGEFRQTAAVGTSQLTATFDRDIYLTKLTATWSTAWSRQLQGNNADPEYELVNHVVADSSGRAYVFGRIWGTVQFGWDGVTQMFTDVGWGDAFVLDVGVDGEYGTTDMFGGGGSEHTWGMAIDDGDNLYLGGAYRGATDFAPGPEMVVHSGNHDGFLLMRRSDRSLGWLFAQENGGWRPYQAIAIKPGGQLASVQNDLVTNPDMATIRTSAHVAADGTIAWTQAIVGPWDLYAHAIAVDADGNVYTAGRFSGSVDFDPGDAFDVRTSNGGLDCFIQSYAADGSYRWTITFGGTGVDAVHGLAALAADDLVVIGEFEDTVDFGSVTVRDVRGSTGASDIFVRRITR